LQCALCAFLGFFPLATAHRDTLAVPLALRAHWLRDTALCALRHQIQSLAPQALFYGKDHTSTLLAVDWSQFSTTPIRPICEYLWIRQHPVTGCALYDEQCLASLVEYCVCRRVTSVCFSLHVKLLWGNQSIVNPTPAVRLTYHVLPPHAFAV
jgi:hypothetical protein